MKKILAGLSACLLASTACLAQAAPRAAEDPSATVVSTSSGAPRVAPSKVAPSKAAKPRAGKAGKKQGKGAKKGQKPGKAKRRG